MSTQLVFEITFDSDYHVGAGHGDGLVDSTLLRDGDGMPVIRGSAITGLLRDAMWRLLQQDPLGGERKCQKSGRKDSPPFCAPEPDACPICRVFGSPGKPKHWLVSSARPIEQSVPGLPGRGEAVGGHVVQRVRVSPRTRRAEPRKLFRQEQGEASWKFSFTVSTTEHDAAVIEEAALLVAAARAVRGLGRARRRGRGICHVHLRDRDAEKQWLDRFKTHWLDDQSLTVKADTVTAQVPAITPSGDSVRLRLIARADEPVLLARRAEAGNEFESARLIPGTALLGALANRTARRYDLKGEDDARAAFVQLFLRGRVRFSALFPVRFHEEDLIPAIPAPLDLLTCKAFPGFSGNDPAHRAAGYALDDATPDHCVDCEERFEDTNVPLKPLSNFVTVYIRPKQFGPRCRHEMHIGVDPATGRVRERDLYGYVSLEAGQYFLGELFCADTAAWQALREIADLPELGAAFTLHIGKATRRGHGQMRMVLEDLSDAGPADPWRGLPLTERVPGCRPANELVMTLLTDVILPDPWGRGRIGFDESWLSDMLGGRVTIVRAFARAREVDGFFGHLGLPRFRDVALVAGSTVGLRFDGAPSADLLSTLALLEREGIGLRREEGYGQVVFNHPIYDNDNIQRLADNVLDLPEALALPGAAKSAPAIVARFRKRWEKELSDIKVSVWQKESFDAIARILRHGAGGSLATLKERLADREQQADGTFGQPRNLLNYDLGGPRSEKAVVRDTRHGRRKIIEMLDQLEQHELVTKHPDLTPQLRRLGIEMLADRVAQGAAAARAQKKE